jgi:hypothetical protein
VRAKWRRGVDHGGGTYVTGPIELRSRVYLRIDAPTVLKNTTDHTRYQPAFIGYPFRFANDPSKTGIGPSLPGKPEAMISAVDVEESGIVGDGTIDGSGADLDNLGGPSWWQLAADAKKLTSYPGFPDIPTSNGLPRPWLVSHQRDMIDKWKISSNPPACLSNDWGRVSMQNHTHFYALSPILELQDAKDRFIKRTLGLNHIIMYVVYCSIDWNGCD